MAQMRGAAVAQRGAQPQIFFLSSLRRKNDFSEYIFFEFYDFSGSRHCNDAIKHIIQNIKRNKEISNVYLLLLYILY